MTLQATVGRGLIFILLLVLGMPAGAATVATVERVAGTVEIGSPAYQALGVGAAIAQGDVITTQVGARLELRFIDGMVLILGENARMQIDTLVYDPDDQIGQAAVQVAQGAFRVISGGIAKLPDHPFHLITPFATIGVRGTDFWGGPLDDPFAMVSLDGTVIITTPAGTTILTKGQGVEIKSLGGGTTAPHPWSPDKTSRAISTITFP